MLLYMQGKRHDKEKKLAVLRDYTEKHIKVTELVKIYGISEKTIYKWVQAMHAHVSIPKKTIKKLLDQRVFRKKPRLDLADTDLDSPEAKLVEIGLIRALKRAGYKAGEELVKTLTVMRTAKSMTLDKSGIEHVQEDSRTQLKAAEMILNRTHPIQTAQKTDINIITVQKQADEIWQRRQQKEVLTRKNLVESTFLDVNEQKKEEKTQENISSGTIEEVQSNINIENRENSGIEKA